MRTWVEPVIVACSIANVVLFTHMAVHERSGFYAGMATVYVVVTSLVLFIILTESQDNDKD